MLGDDPGVVGIHQKAVLQYSLEGAGDKGQDDGGILNYQRLRPVPQQKGNGSAAEIGVPYRPAPAALTGYQWKREIPAQLERAAVPLPGDPDGLPLRGSICHCGVSPTISSVLTTSVSLML